LLLDTFFFIEIFAGGIRPLDRPSRQRPRPAGPDRGAASLAKLAAVSPGGSITPGDAAPFGRECRSRAVKINLDLG